MKAKRSRKRTVKSVPGFRFRTGFLGRQVLQVSDHIGAGNGRAMVRQESGSIDWRDADQTEASTFMEAFIDYQCHAPSA